MAKRKKKVLKKKEEKKEPKVVKKDGMGLDSYFVIRKIKPHRQAGMKAYKGAAEEDLKSLKEWDAFFMKY